LLCLMLMCRDSLALPQATAALQSLPVLCASLCRVHVPRPVPVTPRPVPVSAVCMLVCPLPTPACLIFAGHTHNAPSSASVSLRASVAYLSLPDPCRPCPAHLFLPRRSSPVPWPRECSSSDGPWQSPLNGSSWRRASSTRQVRTS